MSGVYGRKFTSKKNSAFVFFPASGLRYYGYLIGHGSGGLYWSGSLYPSRDDGACSLYFGSGGCVWGSYDRSYGHAVRAVCPYPGLSASIAQE